VRRIVSDTGPLISLEKLPGGSELFRSLYDAVLIPTSVLREVSFGQLGGAEEYLSRYKLIGLVEVVEVEPRAELELDHLDEGERDAILLALQENLPLLIEEQAGRRTAVALGLSISGTAGQVLLGFRSGVLRAETAIEMLVTLRVEGRINDRIYGALAEAIARENLGGKRLG
jgi:predicted nucleic acid-binding protein